MWNLLNFRSMTIVVFLCISLLLAKGTWIIFLSVSESFCTCGVFLNFTVSIDFSFALVHMQPVPHTLFLLLDRKSCLQIEDAKRAQAQRPAPARACADNQSSFLIKEGQWTGGLYIMKIY